LCGGGGGGGGGGVSRGRGVAAWEASGESSTGSVQLKLGRAGEELLAAGSDWGLHLIECPLLSSMPPPMYHFISTPPHTHTPPPPPYTHTHTHIPPPPHPRRLLDAWPHFLKIDFGSDVYAPKIAFLREELGREVADTFSTHPMYLSYDLGRIVLRSAFLKVCGGGA
jgi:hypothetical protein